MVRASILLYHWFAGPTPTRSPEFAMDPAEFRRQMAWLRASGRPLVRVGEVLAAMAGGPALPAGATAVSFDDAYNDFHEHALPVLSELAIPCTLFVVAGRVGGTNDWDRQAGEPARSLMGWPRLREVAAAGIELGSHSLTHPKLPAVGDAQRREETRASKAAIEDAIGRPVPLFAYPHGSHDRRAREAVREAGYEGGCAVLLRPIDFCRSERFALMRVIVHADRSFRSFRARVRLAAPVHRGN